MGRMTEVKVMGEVSEKEEKEKGYDSWELESAADCLLRAAEIKADTKMMAALGPVLDKKAKGMKTLNQLRKLAVKKKAEGL